jgi:MinD-like ATPase involved in chromosome partitioning or flagellar assembly
MERVSMNDGLDGRETVAFGLAASEVAVFVLALMSAYAALRSGLPGAMAWCLATVLVGGGGMLAWGRLAGRPLLEWAVLLARFAVRTRHAHAARVRQQWRRLHPPRPRAESGAVVVRLALRRQGQARGPDRAEPISAPPRLSVVGGPPGRRPTTGARPVAEAASGSRVVAFFSLNGGTGRTTLAVEVAALLAVRGRAAAAAGDRGLRVALLDLTERSPAAALRLGIPLPAGPGANEPVLVVHESGLLVFAGSAAVPMGGVAAPPARTVLSAAERAGADMVVADIDCDLGPCCLEVLQRCDEVHVTVTPTAGGILDAYRSTAVLRRLGLRDRIGYVVNRWREGSDLSEAMDDLGGSIGAEVPEDDGFVEAESRHLPLAVGGLGLVSAALARLADTIERGVGAGCTATEPWAGSNAG